MSFYAIHVARRRSILTDFFLIILVSPAAYPQGAAKGFKTTNSNPATGHQALTSNNSMKALSEFAPTPWPPIDIDAVAAPVTSEVPCSLSSVLRGASQHAVDFASSLERFTATEVIQSASARKDGSWNRLQSRTFNYMALVTRPRASVVYVDESREGNVNLGAPPIRTVGLAATALIFHPQTINDFVTVCEGMGEWHGKPSWMVHFAQKPEIPPHFQSIRVDKRFFKVKLKGRAWIAADSYEIEHIDINLLEPIPQIKLRTEHLSIEYGKVGFKRGNLSLWLPQTVDFYLDMGGHRFFNHHQLSDFLLFSVDLKQETQEPRSLQ
jgi:hypothetical protein